MKKYIKNILLIVVLLVGVISITGCKKENKKEENPTIIGSWEHGSYIYTFNKDKTGNYEAYGNKMEFTYEDDGKKVTILYTGNTTPSSYEYHIEGKKLIIKDSFDNDVEYIKK